MATRLAQCGILTCVVSYTLYPQAKARDMVVELSQALTWTLTNINTFGGDPKQARLLAYRASVITGVTRNLYVTFHAWIHGGEFKRLLSSHLSVLGRCAFLLPLNLAGHEGYRLKASSLAGVSSWPFSRSTHVGHGPYRESQGSQKEAPPQHACTQWES